MLRTYLRIAWRNLSRNKVTSAINIVGLAIGIAGIIFISLFVRDELSYDRFFKNADHIFQVNLVGMENGQEFVSGNTGAGIGAVMAAELPEVEAYTRIYRPGNLVVRYGQNQQNEKFFTEGSTLAVDSAFLQVFPYEALKGDPVSALQKINGVVITERMARKYFGSEEALGKILLFDKDRRPFTVECVLKDLPTQSSLQFDFLLPIAAYNEVKKRSWNSFWLQVSTYLKLKNNMAVDKAAIHQLEAKFPALVKKHGFTRGKSYEDFLKEGSKLEYRLQPLTAVHLYSEGINSRLTTLSNIRYVYIFSIIAVFIVLLACVNFVNLSIAQAAKRAKEVGVRKVLGSQKWQLVKQFLAEALLNSFIATVLAVAVVALFLNAFNQISGKSFDTNVLWSGSTWIYPLALFCITGLLAGSYPAFYLSSFKPVAVLKGTKLLSSIFAGRMVRSGLIVFQFAISIALIVCTIVVFKQLQLTQNKDMGLEKENVVIIANSDRLGQGQEAFKQEILKLPGVVGASITSSIPTKNSFGDSYIPETAQDDKTPGREIALASFLVDDQFIPTLKITMIKGRNFSPEFNDSTSVILNEEAANNIGWKDPVGKFLEYPGNSQKFQVIGVAKDFNIESLHVPVAPFALFHTSSKTYDLGISYMAVRVKPGDISMYLRNLENKWKQFAANTPFDYDFLDQEFESLYKAETRLGTLFTVFTMLSIFIACLGLFGLVAYTAQRRAKEISVRKVLGASVPDLVGMLSKHFLGLVLVSAMIAFPVAWWAMNNWLTNFAYRVSIGWEIFLAAGAAAVLIAFITVSFQAVKAALANPVRNLRSE